MLGTDFLWPWNNLRARTLVEVEQIFIRLWGTHKKGMVLEQVLRINVKLSGQDSEKSIE